MGSERGVIWVQLSHAATEMTESQMGGICVVSVETGHQMPWSRSPRKGALGHWRGSGGASPLLDAAVVTDSQWGQCVAAERSVAHVALARAPDLFLIFSLRGDPAEK